MRRPQAYGDMGDEREHAEPGAVTDGAGRDGAVLGEADSAVAVHAEQDGEDDEGQFDATAPGQAYRGSGGVRGATVVPALFMSGTYPNRQ